jgi:hypothetical protein
MVSMSLPHSSEESASPYFLRRRHHKRNEDGSLFTLTHIRVLFAFSIARTLLVLVSSEDLTPCGMGLGGQSEIRMRGRICTTRPNYAAPEDSGAKAYHLLLEAMPESGFVVIAKVLMHDHENIVIIRA